MISAEKKLSKEVQNGESVWVVTSTHHMGVDGDYTSVDSVWLDEQLAKDYADKMNSLEEYERYNWISWEAQEAPLRKS